MIQFPCGCQFKKNEKGLPIFDPNVDTLPLECSRTWDMICEGNTKGVFQLESNLGQSKASQVNPRNINELSDLLAIIRPGCGDSIVDGKSLTQHYIDRKSKKDPVKFFDPRLEPILGSTYGILVYQEQAMQISQLVAGFTLQQADALRKAIGKKKADLMAEVKEEFIKGAEKLGKFSKNDASEIFSWIEKSQKYSFNKSHSVSYALNAYQTAYAKAHFPRAFFTSYLRHADGKPKPFVEINELVNNARSMDIDVMPPSIKNMNSNFCLIDKKPTFGIVNVKNVGMTVFEQIKGIAKLEKIDVSAITWEEFILKFGRYIKSNSFESMIKAGVFDCYGRSRGEMLHHFNIYKDINNEFKEYLAKVEEKEIGPAFLNLINHIMQSDKRADVKTRRIEELHGAIEVIDKVPYDIKDKPSWIAQQEKELLGIEIVCSEVDEYNTSYATHSCREFKKGMGDKSIRIAAKAEDIREYKVKRGKSSGQKMAFIKISDITCCIDATAFTEEWAQIKKKLDVGGVYLFIGDRDHKTKTSFLLKNVQKLNKCI